MTGVTNVNRAYAPRTLTGATLSVSTSPSESPLVVDVQTFGGFVWTTVATLAIYPGDQISTAGFTASQGIGDLVRIKVTEVETGEDPTGVIVEVAWE
jgi:hypothetical protein